MKQYGVLYLTDGKVSRVYPHDGKQFTLKELQGFVGGHIEHVPHTRPAAYCHEQGLLLNLSINTTASEKFNWPMLRGDVVQVFKYR